MKLNHIFIGLLFTSLFMACEPTLDKKSELPAPADANFSYEQVPDVKNPSNKNFFLFKNTTDGGFLSNWDFKVGLSLASKKTTSTKNVDTVFFAHKGTYKVFLKTASAGGIRSTEKDVVITETSPFAATFDYAPVAGNDYSFKVTTNDADSIYWEFPDGTTSADAALTKNLPFKGIQKVSLTVRSKGLLSKLTQDVDVPNDDPMNPALTDPIFQKLTGGIADADGKTWKFVGQKAGNAPVGGVGPYTSTTTDWYTVGGKNPSYTGPVWEAGAGANEYTFVFRDYLYIPKTTDATLHFAYANKFFGKSQAQYADIQLQDPKLKPARFILKDEKIQYGTGYSLSITNGSYLGYFQNRFYYEIVSLTEDTLYVRQPYSDEPKDAVPTTMAGYTGGVRYFTYAKK